MNTKVQANTVETSGTGISDIFGNRAHKDSLMISPFSTELDDLVVTFLELIYRGAEALLYIAAREPFVRGRHGCAR